MASGSVLLICSHQTLCSRCRLADVDACEQSSQNRPGWAPLQVLDVRILLLRRWPSQGRLY
eukprot:scaffold26708_cov199-Skeletonema_menzelii.AAC.3